MKHLGLTSDSDDILTQSHATNTNNPHQTSDANLITSDITTNNVSTSKHGFCPKAPNSTSVFLRGDATWATPTASASNPWDGYIVGAYGDGDPNLLLSLATCVGSVAPTPTNISTSVARISYFRLPAAITVNRIRFYGVGATSSIYRVAIYNGSTLARLTSELAFSTTAGAWGSISVSLSLSAGQLYFIAVSVNTTGTTAGCLAFSPTVAASTGQIAVVPASYPGNMAITSGYVRCGLAQFAVTNGALPDPAPTIASQAAWTGGMIAFWLDNNNAV